MSDSIKLTLEGGNEIEAALLRLHGKAHDLTPLMASIGTQLESSTADNFKGEHDPFGVAWLKSRRAKMTGGKTLTDTRRLMGSIGWAATSTSVEIGTNVIYAARHNQGFSGTEQVKSHTRIMRSVFGVKLREPKEATIKAHSRKVNTPKRQFLGIGQHDEEEIMALIEDHFGVEE